MFCSLLHSICAVFQDVWYLFKGRRCMSSIDNYLFVGHEAQISCSS